MLPFTKKDLHRRKYRPNKFIYFMFFISCNVLYTDPCYAQPSAIEHISKFDRFKTFIENVLSRKKFYGKAIRKAEKERINSREEYLKAVYESYKERSLIYIDKRIMLLKSARIRDPMEQKEEIFYCEDYSYMYFQFYANSYTKLRTAVETLENPEYFFTPLIKFMIALENGAEKCAGSPIYTGILKRRGISYEELGILKRRWEILLTRVEEGRFSIGAERLFDFLMPIMKRGFFLAEQLNMQPTKHGITREFLQKSIKTIENIIIEDTAKELSKSKCK